MFTAGLFIIATFGNNIHQHGMDKQIEYLHHGTLALKKNKFVGKPHRDNSKRNQMLKSYILYDFM